MTARRRLGRRDQGQATVELALLLPVVVLLLLAVLQLGLVARDVVLVTHAAREAARAAAVDDRSDAPREAAAASGGLDPDRLEVQVTGGAEAGDRVRVEVRYRIRTAVPIVGALIADHEVTSTATMRYEGVGRSFPRNPDEPGHWVPDFPTCHWSWQDHRFTAAKCRVEGASGVSGI